jgi:hypothetical protein
MVSRPVLTVVMEGAVVGFNRKWASAVAESPIKAGVGSSEGAEEKGVFYFRSFAHNDLGVRDVGMGVGSRSEDVSSSGAIGH